MLHVPHPHPTLPETETQKLIIGWRLMNSNLPVLDLPLILILYYSVLQAFQEQGIPTTPQILVAMTMMTKVPAQPNPSHFQIGVPRTRAGHSLKVPCAQVLLGNKRDRSVGSDTLCRAAMQIFFTSLLYVKKKENVIEPNGYKSTTHADTRREGPGPGGYKAGRPTVHHSTTLAVAASPQNYASALGLQNRTRDLALSLVRRRQSI